MFHFTLSISGRKILSNSRSSAIRMSFISTHWNWLGLSPSLLFLINLKFLYVSFLFLCKWSAGAQKGHLFSLYDYLVPSLKVRKLIKLILDFLRRSLGKRASLQPIGRFFSKTANTLKFVNLWNLRFVFIPSLLQNWMTSFLLKMSPSFVKSSLVRTGLERSSRVLFSCA